MKSAEWAWWAGIVIWGLVVVFWQPEPPVSFVEVPSVVPYPKGYRIFYEMIKKETKAVQRNLRKPSSLPEEVDVLVMVSPSEGISEEHRNDLINWVSSKGGILILGYPLHDDKGAVLENFTSEDSSWSLLDWNSGEPHMATLNYSALNVDSPRDVPPAQFSIRGQMAMADSDAVPLVSSPEGETVVAYESLGQGAVIHISDGRLFNNESIGFKKTHLMAAALIDEVGRDKVWAFDESHEGVEIQPAIAPLVGASKYRAVFLHLLLLMFLGYWWKSARLGRPRQAPDTRKIKEVTTMAHDMGNFYSRAGKSQWAIQRYYDYFLYALKGVGVAGEHRRKGEELAKEVEHAINEGTKSMDRHASLIKKMAEHHRVLVQSSKGKNNDSL